MHHVEPDQTIGRKLLRAVAWLTRSKCTMGSLVAIFDRDGKVLLVQGRFRDRNMWGLPGGFAKRKEYPNQTANREVAEETGIHLNLTLEHLIEVYKQSFAAHVEHLFLHRLPDSMDPSTARAGSSEIRRLQWVELDGADPIPTLTAETLVALDKVKAMLEGRA